MGVLAPFFAGERERERDMGLALVDGRYGRPVARASLRFAASLVAERERERARARVTDSWVRASLRFAASLVAV